MTDIYHITHVSNLPGIIQSGCLYCDSLRAQRAANVVGIAHQHIKDRRARRVVPVAPGGVLADYVPFYFAPRSPMLYAIACGAVQGYADGQRPVVHLVANTDVARDLNLPRCYTDGHAEMAISGFYVLPAAPNRVDWEVMNSVYWHDTLEYPDRKRRRQAEYLVHQQFPWTAIKAIGVIDAEMAERVTAVIAAADHRPEVQVQRDWYY